MPLQRILPSSQNGLRLRHRAGEFDLGDVLPVIESVTARATGDS